MRIIGKILLLVLLGGCSSGPKQPTGPLTENRYIRAEDFSRISEFFTGKEPETDRIFVRSDPENRGGYYWIFPIHEEFAKLGVGEILLSVQVPGNPEIREFALTSSRPMDSGTTLWVGLTGEDWPDAELRPIAWQIRILSPDGNILVQRESYLWQSTPLIKPQPGNESTAS